MVQRGEAGTGSDKDVSRGEVSGSKSKACFKEEREGEGCGRRDE